MDEHTVHGAWETFVEQGIASPGVRGAVLDSWQRSRNHRIAFDRAATTLVSEGELHRRRQQGRDLLAAARQALEQARGLLDATGSMLLLTDADGAVLETAGDPATVARGHEVGLQRGGLWSEGDIGTNAIGTALATDTPVRIHAAEHFCTSTQRWTCAAAPIHHPLYRQTLGVVDVSGPPETFSPQNLACAVALAQQVEGTLRHQMDEENAFILHHFLNRRTLWHNDGLLAVASCGRIVHATDSALATLQRMARPLIGQGRIAALGQHDPEHWRNVLHTILPHAALEPVHRDGRPIGAVIILPQRERRQHAPEHPAAMQRAPAVHRTAGGHGSSAFAAIIGDSPAMQQAREDARRMAASGAAILIEGETGVGKELFARAIHGQWAPEGPFVPVNCGGMPRELIGSELFGYVRGAFTGADHQGKPGKIEAAAGGTLCLDEIGEMPLDLQPWLLRVLEDGTVYRIGSHQPHQVQTRLVCITNRDLARETRAGRFRSDLFWRIAVLRLAIPPLRERGDDVILLAEHFARKASTRSGQPPPRLSSAALDLLRTHAWPGNARELRNAIETLMFLSDGGRIDADHLSRVLSGTSALLPCTPPHAPVPRLLHSGEQNLRSLQRNAIALALRDSRGNISRAARKLGIARSTLYARLAGQEAAQEAIAPDRNTSSR